MKLSFKDRIALHYMLATATAVTVVFLIIFLVVRTSVYYNIDSLLQKEAHKHAGVVAVEGDSLWFIHKTEWAEREHIEVDVHPVFIQITGPGGTIMDKSPNLKQDTLFFNPKQPFEQPYTSQLKGQSIRQLQLPLMHEGMLEGYILTAISLKDARQVVSSLGKVLLFLFPVVLLALFFIARYLAGINIRPINRIREITSHITRHNLNERIPLPRNEDELYSLTASINELLQRMENALEREQQFTSDASHELRTPLAVLKGTLEVLARKPRTPEEYQEKIAYSIQQINEMAHAIDQLLQLAHFDGRRQNIQLQEIMLLPLLDEVVAQQKKALTDKQLSFSIEGDPEIIVSSAPYYLHLILENILSNAIKYSPNEKTIVFRSWQEAGKVYCQLQDEGLGIRKEEQDKIFQPFYRSDALNHKHIQGKGLGLSIVKKACDLLHIRLSISSAPQKGTTITLCFVAPKQTPSPVF